MIGFGTRINKDEFDAKLYARAAEWCNQNQATIADRGKYYEVVAIPPHQVTVADYDAAMEAHLLAERTARGYTLREPSDYAGSTVPRFAQDAADWIAHRDEVMLYALEVLNAVGAGEPAPTLEEFKAGLPAIAWTAQESESGSGNGSEGEAE